MRKLIIASILALGAFSTAASAITTDEAGYQIEINSAMHPISGEFQNITITSVRDDLVVQNIVVNRGRCKIALTYPGRKSEFPKRLTYSEDFTFQSFACPKALEVVVYTNRGEVTWSPRR